MIFNGPVPTRYLIGGQGQDLVIRAWQLKRTW
jgi:hypothetical protein